MSAKVFLDGISHFEYSVISYFHRCTGTSSPPCITRATCFGFEKNAEFYSLLCKKVHISFWYVLMMLIQGPPKKCIHALTKENSTLYNRLL